MLRRLTARHPSSGGRGSRALCLEPLESRVLLYGGGIESGQEHGLELSMRSFLAGMRDGLSLVAELNTLTVSADQGTDHFSDTSPLPCCCPDCMRTYASESLDLPTAADTPDGGSGGSQLVGAPLSSIPILNSFLGAAATLYLSFTGRYDATWGSYDNVSTPVYSQDGDPNSFSNSELTSIQSIWAYVSEDYAPFNINVSTATPPSNLVDGVSAVIAIGGSGSWAGGTYGGVAYVNGFTNSAPNVGYVFSNNLGSGNPRFVAEAVSHEAGHLFGLQHQSQYNPSGARVAEYSQSANSGTAPIMGNSYYAARGVWHNGTTTSASTFQDDMNVIARSANGLGYRTDDYGNTVYTAAAVAVNSAGTQFSNSGVITTTNDIDAFAFNTGSGQISITVSVAAGFNNLDSRLELRDAVGNLIASAAPTNSFGATIATTVAAGSYRVLVASQGNYGDVGQYTLSGTITPDSSVGTPSNVVAAAALGSVVNLYWADNASNETYYQVLRSTDGTNWSVAATLAAGVTRYADTNVTHGGTYYYRVQAGNSQDTSNLSSLVEISLSGNALLLANLYQDILGRAPDASGWSAFSSQLSSGTGREAIAQTLLHCQEYYGKVVDSHYATYLNRAADAGGRAYWLNVLVSGGTADSVAQGLLVSSEYASRHIGNQAFVEGLYGDILGRASDAGGMATWLGFLNKGQSRATVVQQLQACNERNRRLVDQAYEHYFERDPDAGGLEFWSNQLRNPGFDASRLAQSLIGTGEYLTRATS